MMKESLHYVCSVGKDRAKYEKKKFLDIPDSLRISALLSWINAIALLR